MEKAVTRRKWTAGLIIAGAAALVITFWSLIMSMLSLLAVAGVLTLLSLPLCKVLEKRLSSGAAAVSFPDRNAATFAQTEISRKEVLTIRQFPTYTVGK